jgi:cardiolipin synthase
LIAFGAAEASLVGLVEAVAAIRRASRGRPLGDFPRADPPEVHLESGEERLKLYPDYGRLYADMIEEIARAERRIVIETFIWQADGWGRRFVETLANKAREGVEVYAIFDELANAGQPGSFKRFPEEINLLRFRRPSGPLDALNPRSAHRDHRKLLAVDGRVAFVGGWNIGDLYTRWRGTHLRIEGPEAGEVERAFASLWNTRRSPALPELPARAGALLGPFDGPARQRPVPPRAPDPGLLPEGPGARYGARLPHHRLLHAWSGLQGRPLGRGGEGGGRPGALPADVEPRPR